MIGERKETDQQNYGTLVMRPYDIAGNAINAFYDSDDNLVFVLDNTISALKPNVLLVINPDADKKWDEILSRDYDVDLETIRPKQDNKYQKLDIEYSGLSVYDNLIRAHIAGEDLDDFLVQLNVLRDSAARHSAMMRLDVANDIIAKTNATIVKTKESIVRLQARIKTLRAKLATTKKEIGKVSTKQSAAKILRIESQIEATNEKLKRAKKRLESAQRRLETATVDAELASELLNQPPLEIEAPVKSDKSVIVAPKHELQTINQDDEDDEDEDVVDDEDDNNTDEDSDDVSDDVKPLFEKDPEILDEDIAFKPISFDTADTNISEDVKEEPVPVVPFTEEKTTVETFEPVNVPVVEEETVVEEEKPVVESFVSKEEKPIIETFEPVSVPVVQESEETKPVLETMTPVAQEEVDEQYTEEPQAVAPVVPITPVPPVSPVPPVVPPKAIVEQDTKSKVSGSKSNIVYYILLFVLILLSVFTLWMYQKKVKPSSPMLAVKTEESMVAEEKPVVKESAPVEQVAVAEEEPVFLDDKTVEEPAPVVLEEAPVVEEETVVEEEPVQPKDVVPEVVDAVSARVISPVQQPEETKKVLTEEEILASKPVYEPGSKHDEMFVDEQYYSEPDVVVQSQEIVIEEPEIITEQEVVIEQEPAVVSETESVEYESPFYDEEEVAYQSGNTGYEE